MLPLSRRIAVSANVVFSLYPTRNKVYLILSYLKATTICVVSQVLCDRENRHEFAKTVPGK